MACEPDGMSEAVASLRDTLREEFAADTEGFLSETTLRRYLVARNMDLGKAAKMIRATVGWRAATLAQLNALNKEASPDGFTPATRLRDAGCRYCRATPGFHPMRQVGLDMHNRPVFYTAFSQANNYWFKTSDTIAHLVPLLENSVASMADGVTMFVWILDFSGFGLGCCNPSQGRTAMSMLADHYPERLERVYFVNTPWVFSGFYAALSPFIDKKTKAKICFAKTAEGFREHARVEFTSAATDWCLEEIALNKLSPIPESQRSFWCAPTVAEVHDPRGWPSYINSYLAPFDLGGSPATKGHVPHHNIALGSGPLPPK